MSDCPSLSSAASGKDTRTSRSRKRFYEHLAMFFIAGVDSVDKAAEVVYGRTEHE